MFMALFDFLRGDSQAVINHFFFEDPTLSGDDEQALESALPSQNGGKNRRKKKAFTVDVEGNWQVAERWQRKYLCTVELSKSSRARCRLCSTNMEKNELRLGRPYLWKGAFRSSWCHPKYLYVLCVCISLKVNIIPCHVLICRCYQLGEPETMLDEQYLARDVHGFTSLTVEQQTQLREDIFKEVPQEEVLDPNDPSFAKSTKTLKKVHTLIAITTSFTTNLFFQVCQ